jgi:pimeloyl-ACP methyl ester carboxylesterase
MDESRKNPSPSSDLVCPSCGRPQEDDERFCLHCGMPLVIAGADEEPVRSEAHERARKIRPEYARGELVRVAGGRNQAEAELIQNLLIEEGVPSLLRRTRGFDVPDFLAAGPRDVMVPESGAQAAHDVLQDAQLLAPEGEPGGPTRRQTVVVGAAILGGGFVAALIAWLLLEAGA